MWSFGVPNVPCGVESPLSQLLLSYPTGFLMYRVELKDVVIKNVQKVKGVPNVPCGVESGGTLPKKEKTGQFLMYRVELKGPKLFF